MAKRVPYVPQRSAMAAAIEQIRTGGPVLVGNAIGPDQFPDMAVRQCALLLWSGPGVALIHHANPRSRGCNRLRHTPVPPRRDIFGFM